LQGIGHGRYAALSILAAMFVKVAGNLILIPHFGMEGAALSTVMATSIAAVLQLIKLQTATKFLSKVRAVNLFSYLLSLGVMAAGVLLWIFIAENIFEGVSRVDAMFISITSSVLGGVIYLTVIIKFKIFSKGEWESVFHSAGTVKKVVERLKKRRPK
jgi:polysaccharide transporter, PST family